MRSGDILHCDCALRKALDLCGAGKWHSHKPHLPARDSRRRDAEFLRELFKGQPGLLAVGADIHGAIHTRRVSYTSSNFCDDLRGKVCHGAGAPGFIIRMGRKPNPKLTPPDGMPHSWAYLSAWREVNGLTQDDVADRLQTSGATISRWEHGRATMKMSDYQRLAEIYGASDVGMLTLPPPKREHVSAVREALRIIAAMEDDQARADWLAHGRVLASVPKAREK